MITSHDNIILGSGPASVSAAMALLAQGKRVTMIDPGLTLEQRFKNNVEALSQKKESEWTPDELRSMRGGAEPTVGGLPEKFSCGSNYPFRWIDPTCELHQEGVETLTSFAQGGLSNVWGSNAFVLPEREFTSWPFTRASMLPYYEKVAGFMPLSASHDSLEEIIPLGHKPSATSLKLSLQAQRLVKRLHAHKETLAVKGFSFGQSRLAVDAAKCTYCGLCLYGCPYDLIYSSATTLQRRLLLHPDFTYLSGKIASLLQSSPEGVAVTLTDLNSGNREILKSKKVFVGCGAVQSARLIIKSLGAWNQEFTIADSQYFIAPFVSFKPTFGVAQERLHTLSQLAFELDAPEISNHLFHLLFYTYNDLYKRALMNMVPSLLRSAAEPMIGAGLGFLSILQGYLHSNDSSKIIMRMEQGREKERLVLYARQNLRAKQIVADVIKRFNKEKKAFGGIALPFMAQLGKPGKSYHMGATFPMKERPNDTETNLLGTLSALPHIHLIDAAVFPDIPAVNHTFTIMANAYRIATEVG